MGQPAGVASIPLLLPASISSARIPFLFWQAQPARGTWPPTLRIVFLNTWAFHSLHSLPLSFSRPTDNFVMRVDACEQYIFECALHMTNPSASVQLIGTRIKNNLWKRKIGIARECEGTGFIAIADNRGAGVEHVECG